MTTEKRRKNNRTFTAVFDHMEPKKLEMIPLMCYETTILDISIMSLTREPLIKLYKDSLQVNERSVCLYLQTNYS